jgi:hypothetical protein
MASVLWLHVSTPLPVVDRSTVISGPSNLCWRRASCNISIRAGSGSLPDRVLRPSVNDRRRIHDWDAAFGRSARPAPSTFGHRSHHGGLAAPT